MILVLLKSTVCKEIVRLLWEKSLKKTKLFQKHGDLRSRGAHGVWWRIRTEGVVGGPEPALTDSSEKLMLGAHGMTVTLRRPGSGRPQSVWTTDNIAVEQECRTYLSAVTTTRPTPTLTMRSKDTRTYHAVPFDALHILTSILKRTK